MRLHYGKSIMFLTCTPLFFMLAKLNINIMYIGERHYAEFSAVKSCGSDRGIASVYKCGILGIYFVRILHSENLFYLAAAAPDNQQYS